MTKEDFVPDQIVTYKQVDGVNLQLNIFHPPVRNLAEKVPAIVFFSGGGWKKVTPAQFHPHAAYLASRGMVAISANYRVQSMHGVSPYQSVADGKSALRWVRRHASELGIDPDRIAGGGGSAGAQMAAAAALVEGFDQEGEARDVSCKPNALALFNPVFDNGPGGYGYDRVNDRWEDFSPLHNIAAGAPPTIVFLGTADKLIPVSTAEAYKKRMLEVGARCDLWIYEAQPHGFFNYRDGQNPIYDATLLELDRFFASLGYLTGKPSLAERPVEGAMQK